MALANHVNTLAFLLSAEEEADDEASNMFSSKFLSWITKRQAKNENSGMARFSKENYIKNQINLLIKLVPGPNEGPCKLYIPKDERDENVTDENANLEIINI